MHRWIVAAGISLALGATLAACSGSESGTTLGNGGPCPGKTPPVAQSDADMSVEELTDLVAEAIACPGYAFHMRSEDENALGFLIETGTWIDVENNLARSESVWRASSGDALREAAEAGVAEDAEARWMVIYRADARYDAREFIGYPENEDLAYKRSPSDCHGAGLEALGPLIPCEGPLDDWERTVERGVQFLGKPSIAVLTAGVSGDADGDYEITMWLYLDAKTLLPLGRLVETERGAPIDTDATYKHDFVPLDSLPDDFFDPASIGYVETDLEEPLDDAEIDIYWIGREFEGRDEYPALAIRHATARPRSQTGGGSVAQIAYRSADDEFGRIWVRIDLFTPEAFEFRDGETVLNECEETIAVDILGGQATIRRHHNGRGQNPDGSCNPPDRYSAVVRFEDVVVDIDAPSTGNGRETFPSPYNTEAAMELLIMSLVLRE